MPYISLVASQTSAMYTGLLSSTNTNSLTVLGIANRVGLSVLQGNQGDKQISLGCFVNNLILSRNVLQTFLIQLYSVPLLLKGNAEYFLLLQLSRLIGLVHLQYQIGALALALENLQSLWRIGWSNNTIRNLTSQEGGCLSITLIRQSYKITIGGHAVSATSSNISSSNRR